MKTLAQKKQYAIARMRLATDRAIFTDIHDDKVRAARWVSAWAAYAGQSPSTGMQRLARMAAAA